MTPFFFLIPIVLSIVVLLCFIFIETLTKLFKPIKNICVKPTQLSPTNNQGAFSVTQGTENPLTYDQAMLSSKDVISNKNSIKKEDDLPSYSELHKTNFFSKNI